MASLEELRNERIKKMNTLIEAGHNPYPVSVKRDVTLLDAVSDFGKLSKRKKPLAVVGRVMSLRKQGGLAFFDLDDGSGLPERGSQSGLPERGSQSGLPERGSQSGLPERGSQSGLPERGSQSGLPERGSQSGRLQALLKKDDAGEQSFNLFVDTVDIGDFLE